MTESSTRYGYEGKEHDSVVGDTDFHFRKYKAEWALFLQPDSLPNGSISEMIYNPQELNRYSFEKNNPYKYKDKNGHNPAIIDAISFGMDIAIISGYYDLIEINKNPALGLELDNALKDALSGLVLGQAMSSLSGPASPFISATLTGAGILSFGGYQRKVALENPQRYLNYLDNAFSNVGDYGSWNTMREQQLNSIYHPGGVDIRSLSSSFSLLSKYGGSNSIRRSMQHTSLTGSSISWYYNINSGHYTYRADGTQPKGSGWTGGGSSGGGSSGGSSGGGTDMNQWAKDLIDKVGV